MVAAYSAGSAEGAREVARCLTFETIGVALRRRLRAGTCGGLGIAIDRALDSVRPPVDVEFTASEAEP